MSKKEVVLLEKKPFVLQKTAWAVAIPIILALLAAAGVDVNEFTSNIPEVLLPGALLSAAAMVVMKIITWAYYRLKKKITAKADEEKTD